MFEVHKESLDLGLQIETSLSSYESLYERLDRDIFNLVESNRLSPRGVLNALNLSKSIAESLYLTRTFLSLNHPFSLPTIKNDYL